MEHQQWITNGFGVAVWVIAFLLFTLSIHVIKDLFPDKDDKEEE